MENYPYCYVSLPSLIGDGYCDCGDYNTIECGFDGGDCEEDCPDCYPNCDDFYPNCNVQYPSLIGDGNCHAGDYNTAECGFDGGDCDYFNKYPNCNAQSPWRIRNGNCDNYGDYNTAACGFDGGDCDCNIPYPYLIGDGNCDGGNYNTLECGFDGGDCGDFNAKFPNCTVSLPSLIGNGNCDGGDYNTLECGFDGGDCSSGMYAENSFPGWPVVGGVAGGALLLFTAIGIVICKMKRNAITKHLQEVIAGDGGVQTGNAKYDMNNQQGTSSVLPSAVPVYAFEAAPTTKQTAFCANCGKANSKSAFCTGCGVPN